LQCWTRGRTGWIGRLRAAQAELRVELGVTRLEDADERARRHRRADGLHLGELAALPERLEELRRLPGDFAVGERLRQDDRPRRDRNDDQNREDRLVDDGRLRDDVD